MGIDKHDSNAAARSILKQANIAPVLWKHTLPGLGANGKMLRKYINSEEYDNDCNAGIGYCIYGHSYRRIDLFYTFVKELALSGDGLYLITLRKLTTALVANDNEFLYTLDRVVALALSYFYDSSLTECPYSFSERSLVEDYLRTKLYSNQRIYVSSTSSIENMKWWSEDFRTELKRRSKELGVGKSDRG